MSGLPGWLEERRHWVSANNTQIVEMLDLIERYSDFIAEYTHTPVTDIDDGDHLLVCDRDNCAQGWLEDCDGELLGAVFAGRHHWACAQTFGRSGHTTSPKNSPELVKTE